MKKDDIVKRERIICEDGSCKGGDKIIEKGKIGTVWYIWGLFSGFGAFALCLVLTKRLI